MIRRPPRSTQSRSSAASDVYKRQGRGGERNGRNGKGIHRPRSVPPTFFCGSTPMLTHNSLNVHSEIPRSCSSAHSSLWLVDLPTGRSKLSSLSWTELLRLDTLVDNRQNRSHAGYLKQPSLPSTNGDVSSVVGSAQNSTSTALRTVVRVATPINASRCDYYCDQLSTT